MNYREKGTWIRKPMKPFELWSLNISSQMICWLTKGKKSNPTENEWLNFKSNKSPTMTKLLSSRQHSKKLKSDALSSTNSWWTLTAKGLKGGRTSRRSMSKDKQWSWSRLTWSSSATSRLLSLRTWTTSLNTRGTINIKTTWRKKTMS